MKNHTRTLTPTPNIEIVTEISKESQFGDSAASELIYFGLNDGTFVYLLNYYGPSMPTWPDDFDSCREQIYDPRVRPWYKSFLFDRYTKSIDFIIGE